MTNPSFHKEQHRLHLSAQTRADNGPGTPVHRVPHVAPWVATIIHIPLALRTLRTLRVLMEGGRRPQNWKGVPSRNFFVLQKTMTQESLLETYVSQLYCNVAPSSGIIRPTIEAMLHWHGNDGPAWYSWEQRGPLLWAVGKKLPTTFPP
jgi:hypothetical protein